MRLLLVRHGETDWNVEKRIQGTTDVPLNEHGLRQAKQLAEKLVRDKVTAARVYSSPQKRAFVTAQLAAAAIGVDCVLLDDLREMDLGEWEGLKWKDIEQRYGDIYEQWNRHRRYEKTPGGESYNEVLGRVLHALGHILDRETEDVLVVTHSAVIMALRCYLAGREFKEDVMIRCFKSRNTEIVCLDAAEVKAGIEKFRVT